MAIYVNNQYVPYNNPKFLRKHCFYQEAVNHLKRKYDWSNKTYQNIHWDAHKKCVNIHHFNKRKQHLKFIHNHLAIGKLNFESCQTCPMCGMNETMVIGHYQDHFLCCNNSHKNENKRIAIITQQLTTIHTNPMTRKMLIDNIIRYYENKPPIIEHGIHKRFIES